MYIYIIYVIFIIRIKNINFTKYKIEKYDKNVIFEECWEPLAMCLYDGI